MLGLGFRFSEATKLKLILKTVRIVDGTKTLNLETGFIFRFNNRGSSKIGVAILGVNLYIEHTSKELLAFYRGE